MNSITDDVEIIAGHRIAPSQIVGGGRVGHVGAEVCGGFFGSQSAVDEVRSRSAAGGVGFRDLVHDDKRGSKRRFRVGSRQNHIVDVVERNVVINESAVDREIAVEHGKRVDVGRFDREDFFAGPENRQLTVILRVNIDGDRGVFEIDDVIIGGRANEHDIVGGRFGGLIDRALERVGGEFGQFNDVDLSQSRGQFELRVGVADFVVFGRRDRIDRE